MEKQRNLSIELLRILSMFLIVLHHSVYHGYLKNDAHIPKEALTSFIGCLGAGGKVGVYIFIMISGYFLIQSNKWRFNKLKSIYGEVWFYSIAALLLNSILHITTLNLKCIVKSIFPIIFGSYWFMTAYMILLLLIPFINRCIETLTKKQFQWLLMVLVLFSILIPTFPYTKVAENNIGLFITLYLTGGYLKKYPFNLTRKKQLNWSAIGCVISAIVLFATVTLLSYSHVKNVLRFAGNYSIFVYAISICLFLFFANLHIYRGKKLILTLSSATLGVYLIHDNFIIRKLLWTNLLHLTHGSLESGIKVILTIIIASAIIYAICTLIDLLRQWCFKKVSHLLNHKA